MRILGNLNLPDFGRDKTKPKADGAGARTSDVQPSPSIEPQDKPNKFLDRGYASKLRNLYKRSTLPLSDAVNKLRSGSSAKTSLKTPDASVTRGTAGRLRSKFLRQNPPETKISEKAPKLEELPFEKDGQSFAKEIGEEIGFLNGKSFAEEIAKEIGSVPRDNDSTVAAKEPSAPSKNTESDATSSRIRVDRKSRFRESIT